MTIESSDLNEKGREHKRTEERIYHLNVLLRAIRNVSQFIAREKDRGRLIEGACKYLTEGGAYCSVWIAFLNESQRLVGLSPIPDKDLHSEGNGDEIGDWGKCAEKAMSQSGPYVVDDSQLICADCNLNKRCGGKKAITAKLEFGGEILGLIMASIEGDRNIDREERSLFEEVAGDLAFALHGIEIEEDRKRAAEALLLEQSRLEALLDLSQMTMAPIQEITDFSLEAAVRLTGSTIGYLAFMNEDETVLTMHSWSKTAMKKCAIADKPIVYPVETTGLWGEAVRQRKPVITNDYSAPNPLKKGYPQGHVEIIRHMNVPVFDGERIVAVAGVGNKDENYDESDVRQLKLLMQGMWRLVRRKQNEQELQEAYDKLERRVQERTSELNSANWELKQEIVERERAEKVLKDSQALYSSLVENLPVHVLRKDLDGRFTFANKSFCDLIGKSLEEIAGKTDFDFYPEELAEKYRQDDQRVIDTGELFETVEVNKKDGDIRYVQVMKSAVRDAGGRIAGVQVIFWDVTERHKAEAALEQERYLLHALMDNLPHSIYFKDAKSCFIRINRALAKYFGLSDASEALGKTDSEFFADEHALQAKADEELVMRTGRPLLDKEEKETWPDGHETWVMSTKLPLYNEQGEIVGTFGISRDITEQRRAAEALRAAKEAAEVASRAKSDFLATMSHEIRTPMNGIIGMIDLLFGTNPTGQQRMYLELAGQSAETLLRLINDILDFSKIEAGKLELEFVGFKLRDTMGDTLQTLAGRASEKDLELTYHIPPEVPDDLVGDPGRFCQVIVNLVGNAIKFTEKGEIAVKVKLESLENHEARLHFAVSDTGPGVAPEKQRLIFEAFRQADSSMSRRFGGTGLGLAISSHLVEMMKGRMWLESMEGQGSTFHFTAVFSLREGALVEPGPGPVTLHGLRVLVVDDNKTNLLIMEEILKNWCMNPVVVENGQAALAEITRATETGESYSLVLLDGMMPGMDGFEVAEQIRKTSEVSETTIIMLSSARNLGDGARCRELGIDHCLMKPVKQSELLDSITSSLRVATADKPNESPPNKHRETTMCLNVLLVEDGLVNQKVAVNLLEQRRHKVTVANDGREAVDALEKESFDAVLMDIQMPVMDGFEATGIIRRREKVSGEHIPIIAMTAHAMEGDRERCLEAGMDAYIAKPIRAKALYDTLETTVERLCAPKGKQNEPAGENEILDRSQILEQIGGSSEVLKEIVELFNVESKSLLKKMQDAIKNENPSGLQRAAHTLKGSVRVFGAERVASATLRLEKISESKNLNDAEDAWMELKRELERLVPMLDKLLKS